MIDFDSPIYTPRDLHALLDSLQLMIDLRREYRLSDESAALMDADAGEIELELARRHANS